MLPVMVFSVGQQIVSTYGWWKNPYSSLFYFQDSNGREFTVVLLDSEGIDAASSVGYDDNQIFTLTVLLASVLIYNSQGVPTRRDLEGLEYPLLTLVYLYSLSYCSLSNCLVCLFAFAFLGGEKKYKKV